MGLSSKASSSWPLELEANVVTTTKELPGSGPLGQGADMQADRKLQSTRDVARWITENFGPAHDYQIRRLADCGDIPKPLVIGRYRAFLAEDLPTIVAAMRRRGWLPAESEVASAS